MNLFSPSAAVLGVTVVLASLLAASPSAQAQNAATAGQNATTNSQLTTANTANALGTTAGSATGGQQSGSGVTTGVICIQEMTATFCNVVGGPNTDGYGSAGGSGAGTGSGSGSGSAAASASGGASGGTAATTSSIPACGGFPSPNELCN